MHALAAYLVALCLTVAVELGVVALLGGRRLWRQVVLVNLVTHPLLNATLLLAQVQRGGAPLWRTYPVTLPELLGLELLVVGVESALLAWAGQLGATRALLLALTMNVASLAVGLAVAP